MTVSDFAGGAPRLANATIDLRRFERRDGEVLLRGDVLGHRLIDIIHARLMFLGAMTGNLDYYGVPP